MVPGNPLLDQGLQLLVIRPVAHDDVGKGMGFINPAQIIAQLRRRHDGLGNQAAIFCDDSGPGLFRTRINSKDQNISPLFIGFYADIDLQRTGRVGIGFSHGFEDDIGAAVILHLADGFKIAKFSIWVARHYNYYLII